MRLYKNDSLTIRLNPILKSKFNIAIGFLGLSEVLNNMIQDYVRDYEKQFGVIPVSTNKSDQYDILTKMFGVKINQSRFEELINSYPKSRKGIAIYGN